MSMVSADIPPLAKHQRTPTDVCLRTTSRDILGLCKLLKIKSPRHEESFPRKPQNQEFAPVPVTTQRPPKPDKFRIKLPKQVKPQKRQNIKEMALNAKKMAFKEHMLEKYRKAKIRKTQKILLYGKFQKMMSRAGNPHGARVDQAGILNAQ